MFEDMRKSRMNFSFVEYDDKGNEKVNISRTIYDPDLEYLPNVLETFTYFLHGLTYTWVSSVQCVRDDGTVNASSHDAN